MSATGGASVSGTKSKSSTGSRVFLGEVSKALRGINLDFARQVLQQLQATGGFASQLQNIPGLIEGFQGNLDSLTASDKTLQDLLTRGGAATPEQQQLIQDIATSQIQSGTSDINAQLETGLGLVRNELGPGLGLRPGDTPLIDRGNLLAKEAGRQQANLVTNVRGQQSQNLLDYPLRSTALSGSLAEAQAQLRSQAFANRLALTGQAGGLGLGLARSYDPAQGFSAISSVDPRAQQTDTRSLGGSAAGSASYGFGTGGGGGGGG